MKKLLKYILLISSLFISTTTLAESYKTIIFNMNEKYDINLTYRICSRDSQQKESCANNETAQIKAKKSPNDKNYIEIMREPINPDIQTISIKIVSAEEKDEFGKIVAQTKYLDDNSKLISYCGGYLYNNHSTNTPLGYTFLVMNDMHQSPYIVCNAEFFVSP